MHTLSPYRRGLSLVEVIIAMAILGVVIAMTFEGLGASTRLEALGVAQDELSEESRTIIRSMQTDMAMSGWHLADRIDSAGAEVLTNVVTYDPSAGGWNHNDIYATSDPAVSDPVLARKSVDRNNTYFPLLQVHPFTATGAGAPALSVDASGQSQAPLLAYTHRAATSVDGNLNGAGLGSSDPLLPLYEALPEEYRGASVDLTFLRTTVNGWSAKPEDQQTPALAFPGTTAQWQNAAANAASPTPDLVQDAANRAALGVLYMSGWVSDPAQPDLLTYRDPVNRTYGVVLDGGYVDVETGAGSVNVRPKWETLRLSNAASPAINGLPSNLRPYTYAVVRGPKVRGFGRLVRAVCTDFDDGILPDRGQGTELGQWISRDPATNRANVIEKIYSDNITRVTFETRRHLESEPGTTDRIQLNQVRMRLYMARMTRNVEGTEMMVRRRADVDFFLGTRNSSTDIAYDLEALGTPVGSLWQ
jgi:prepilin-type N-terminal cleavage/methylation domain-containing protein